MLDSMPAELERLVLSMIRDYQDLNPSYVEELSCDPDALPSPVDFSRFVRRNRPVVFRNLGRAMQVPALQRWTSKYLSETMGEAKIKIAATPDGNADAIVEGHFVEPTYLEMTMPSFLSTLCNPTNNDVLYLQSQNDNLNDDMTPLLRDTLVPGSTSRGLPFANEVFGSEPEVANVWIGDEKSVTSLHKDPYENVYLVVRGEKRFDLLPPTEFYCLHEQQYPCANFKRTSDGWKVIPTDPMQAIPWIPVDPVAPDLASYPRFRHARPMSVTVREGDVLYLPALWFHKVGQKPSQDPEAPLAIAVNWWYDLAYDSPTWTLARLVRQLALAVDGKREDVDSDDDA